MISHETLSLVLIASLIYTQYNLWVVKKQLQLLLQSLEDLRDE